MEVSYTGDIVENIRNACAKLRNTPNPYPTLFARNTPKPSNFTTTWNTKLTNHAGCIAPDEMESRMEIDTGDEDVDEGDDT